jgi:8-oxo-dGTP diphosphatase
MDASPHKDYNGSMRADVEAAYGHRIRVRVGALLFDDPADPGALLLVEHVGMYGDDPFWTPAGGGISFGEPLRDALCREVEEETGLSIEVGALRYVLDFVRPPLHTVSFYFEARATGGTLTTGSDPELGDHQLIRTVSFVPFSELTSLTIYPEGLAQRLPRDAAAGFPTGTQYLGTLR